MSKLIPYIIILTLLLNCTNSTEEPEIGQGNKLVKVDEYSLPLPLKNKPNSWIQKFYDKNGHRLLHYFDKYSQEILVYDIKDKELKRTITLKETGPNSVGIANGVSVRSPDSIYLTVGRPVLTIMNKKGEKVGETEFDWSEASNQVQDFTPLRSRYYADISFDGDVLYAPQRVPFRGYPPPLEIDHKPIVRHDESSGKSELVDFDYPKDYWEDRMPYFLTFNHDADNLYYSLTANHNIYKITKRDHEVTEVYAKSKFAPEKIENYSNLSGQDDARLYAAMNPRYSALLPDRFRKLFYRIVLLPPHDLEQARQRFTQITFTPDRFAIMVLDEDLRVIYEQDFPERLYYPNGIFITEDGVHIPKTHPEYMVKNGIEDRLDYEVFRFEGN